MASVATVSCLSSWQVVQLIQELSLEGGQITR